MITSWQQGSRIRAPWIRGLARWDLGDGERPRTDNYCALNLDSICVYRVQRLGWYLNTIILNTHTRMYVLYRVLCTQQSECEVWWHDVGAMHHHALSPMPILTLLVPMFYPCSWPCPLLDIPCANLIARRKGMIQPPENRNLPTRGLTYALQDYDTTLHKRKECDDVGSEERWTREAYIE